MRTYLFGITVLLWIVVGLVWLLPRKLRLMRRLGHLTAGEIIQRGKEGDVEARNLHRDTSRFIIFGLMLVLPQVLLGQLGRLP